MKEQKKKLHCHRSFPIYNSGKGWMNYIGLVSYRVNCHLNIVVPKKKAQKIYLEPY
jgi:hypothetical protein